jgi:hypothetical protein
VDGPVAASEAHERLQRASRHAGRGEREVVLAIAVQVERRVSARATRERCSARVSAITLEVSGAETLPLYTGC